jgi:hypothetical protein
MSRVLSLALTNAVQWFDDLRVQGIDITDSAHIKARKEAQEFEADPSLEEAADVVIAIVGACHAQGWGLLDLGQAVMKKMHVNRQRTWRRTEDGTWQHE